MKAGLLLILLGNAFVGSLYGQNTADETKIKQVIQGFFQAFSDEDIPKLRSYCQADFTLLENGEIWSLDTLEAKLKPNFGKGMRRINTIYFSRIQVKRATAWVAYSNQAAIAMKGRKATIHWLESAVLEKSKGAWKLSMLHSTKLPPKKLEGQP
ncbi:nuclear transport factor 2 family protein [Spirosoma utsteinense]|uniref:Ketosteroid isomerase-like protein n=1 Tax=Spirosoma utsteinense TaxID=2585773 RepID=A0ABR6W8P9_9BACT|nr:nuclear transport factor 2 family protein [Spirosoma utsteinense]MBC3792175.1 ketosteroid isomerase-like protein [Spirosoma utsteinense]